MFVKENQLEYKNGNCSGTFQFIIKSVFNLCNIYVSNEFPFKKETDVPDHHQKCRVAKG